MRHINRRRDKTSTYGDPDDILTEPHEQYYVKSYRNNGFKNASSKNTYVKFLRYISDNPGSTRKEILDGLGRLKGAADGGRGQNSSLFAQLLYLDLIDYDDKFKYFITDKGEEVLEKADKNDQGGGTREGDADEGPDSAMESTRKTTMKRLNITKEHFNKSRYFQRKYGELEYVSESGRLFKTNKGKVLMFKESVDEPKYSIGDTVYIYSQEWIVEKVRFSERIGEFVYDLYTDDGGHTISIPENHLSDTPSKPPRRPRNRKFNESDKKFSKMDESMNWNGVTDKFIDNDNVQFTRRCPSCGKPHSITVPIRDVEDGCSAYGRGARMQDAFPNFSADEREFFMTGICPDCWENM